MADPRNESQVSTPGLEKSLRGFTNKEESLGFPTITGMHNDRN